MIVFTDEWIQQLQEECKAIPEKLRPSIYFFVTSERNQELLLRIENLVAALPITKHKEVISRFRDNNHFRQAYYELVAGNVLKELGYEAFYEVPVGEGTHKLTPDWYVPQKNNRAEFVVEMFTANTSNVRNKQNNNIYNLWARLEQIPIDVYLVVEVFGFKDDFDQASIDAIFKKVQKWLTDHKPRVRKTITIEGLSFTIGACDIGYPHVVLGFNTPPVRETNDRIKKNIEKKIERYKDVVECPLVVGIIANPETSIKFEDIEDVLLGEKYFVVICDGDKKVLAGPGWLRKENGLFDRTPELSAVLWIWQDLDHEWKIKPIHNPTTNRSLPLDTFVQKECLNQIL